MFLDMQTQKMIGALVLCGFYVNLLEKTLNHDKIKIKLFAHAEAILIYLLCCTETSFLGFTRIGNTSNNYPHRRRNQ